MDEIWYGGGLCPRLIYATFYPKQIDKSCRIVEKIAGCSLVGNIYINGRGHQNEPFIHKIAAFNIYPSYLQLLPPSFQANSFE